MNDVPKLRSVLKPFRGQDVFDNLRSELVFGPSPEGGKAKLCVGVHGRFFENAFPWVEVLAYEWVIEPWLPFLDPSEFKTSVISSFREDGNRSPNVQIVVFLPVAKSQFSLDKFVLGELEKPSGATVFAIQLHVHNMCETNVDTLGRENICAKRLWAVSEDSHKWLRLATPFQNRF